VPIARRTDVPSKGAFTFTFGSAVSRDNGPLESREFTVPAGEKDLRVTFSTPDASADNIIDYSLVEPDGLDDYYDRTPSTTPQGIGSSTPNGHGAIVVADPSPGVWLAQAMVDFTESGKEFTQTVTGKVSFNTANVVGDVVPNTPTRKLAAGSHNAVLVAVTNTTGVGRDFTLLSTNGDVTGPDVYIPAGASALVTGTLTPTAASGTAVTGEIAVVSEGSALSSTLEAAGYFFDLQTLALLPYSYTVM
jgi:hypothetical protein